FLLSVDGGTTWKRLLLPNGLISDLYGLKIDTGGPFAQSRYSNVRIGTAADPFVLGIPGAGIWAVSADGNVRVLVPQSDAPSSNIPVRLAGQDSAGGRFLYRIDTTISYVNLSGSKTLLGSTGNTSSIEGWITPSGDAYVEERTGSQATLEFYRAGSTTGITIAQAALNTDPSQLPLFGVPTFDYSGAWVITRGGGKPT